MKISTDFSILYSGIFSEENLHCVLLPGEKEYSFKTSQKIEKAWRQRANSSLYSGSVYSLVQTDLRNSQIHYRLQKTNYKSFYGTNLQQADSKEGANILAVCSVIETADAFILVGKRSAQLAESPYKWHVIGGSIDTISSSYDTSFEAIRKEIREETGIDRKDMVKLICLGLGKNNEIHKPEFLFYTKLTIGRDELETRVKAAEDKQEHSQFCLIPSKEIESFITSNPFSIIGKAAVHQYLHFKDVL